MSKLRLCFKRKYFYLKIFFQITTLTSTYLLSSPLTANTPVKEKPAQWYKVNIAIFEYNLDQNTKKETILTRKKLDLPKTYTILLPPNMDYFRNKQQKFLPWLAPQVPHTNSITENLHTVPSSNIQAFEPTSQTNIEHSNANESKENITIQNIVKQYINYRIIKPNDSFQSIIKKLSKANEYKLLEALSWHQTLTPFNKSLPVYLNHKTAVEQKEEALQLTIDFPIPTTSKNEIAVAEKQHEIDIYETPTYLTKFDGTIELLQKRYFHLGVKLQFYFTKDEESRIFKQFPLKNQEKLSLHADKLLLSIQKDQIDSQQESNTVKEAEVQKDERITTVSEFQTNIQEKRRIEISSLEFFDHPLFGVIVQIEQANLEEIASEVSQYLGTTYATSPTPPL